MSPRRQRDVDDGGDPGTPPGMPDRTDGATELGLRESFLVLFYDPAVRNYTIAAFSALAMIFLVLFMNNSDVGGLIVVLLGAAGILLRWVAAPPLVLLVLTYFLIFPLGVPDNTPDKFEIDNGRFRMPDVILALSVLVYVAGHYRLIGFVHQAVAYDGAAKRRDELPTRRPPALVAPAELGVFLGLAAVLVVAGQLVWLYATSVEIDPTADFPIRWVGEGRTTRDREAFGIAPVKTTIFFVLLGLLFFGTLLTRLVFGYWRLRMMNAAEGGMILLDGGWAETKRERSRLEKWRIWGRKRAEDRARAKAEDEAVAAARERAAKARAERQREEHARRERDKLQRSGSRGRR